MPAAERDIKQLAWRVGAGSRLNARAIALLVAGIGTAVYFAVAFGLQSLVGVERFGTLVYNYYFLALIEGRFDVPLRIITLEGHYDAAGRAFVYHGLAPLVTRALAWPFVDLTAVSLAPLTIFLAAVGGTAVYHFVFVQIIEKFAAHDPALQRAAGLLLGIMIWFGSPGLLLVANTSFFHEPTAMAYLFVAAYLGLLCQVVLFEKPVASVLLPMAAFAGLCVYARPHLALGLYAAVCLLALVVFWQQGWRGLPRAASAVGILFLFGAALLVFNELRFGNMLQMSSGGDVKYGFFYWGAEPVDSPRKAGDGYGRFSAYRLVPNLMLYLFDVPGGRVSDALMAAFRSMSSWSGYVRVEHPRVGMVFAWLPWFMLVLAGLRGGAVRFRHAWAPLLAAGIGGLMMASYTTVTLRYRFDLWPVLMVFAILSLPRILVRQDAAGPSGAGVLRPMNITLVASLIVVLATIYLYQFRFIENGLFSRWSYETCAEMVTAKPEFGTGDVDRLCQF